MSLHFGQLRIAGAALALVLGATLSACGPGPSDTASTPAAGAASGATISGQGVFVGLVDNTVTIEHQGVGDRPAGRETFPADATALADAPPAEGAQVSFELFVSGDQATVTSLGPPAEEPTAAPPA